MNNKIFKLKQVLIGKHSGEYTIFDNRMISDLFEAQDVFKILDVLLVNSVDTKEVVYRTQNTTNHIYKTKVKLNNGCLVELSMEQIII